MSNWSYRGLASAASTGVAAFALAACGGEDAGFWTRAEALAPTGSGASFVTSTVPVTMDLGERRNVTITMRNTGAASPANDWDSTYRLQSVGGSSFSFLSYVQGTVTASPQDDETFNVVLQAPDASVVASAAYQMLSVGSGVVGYFGSQNTESVTISSQQRHWDCAYVSDTFPASLTPGEVRDVTVTVQNTGSQTWASGANCLYDRDSVAWGGAPCILNSASVAPGANHTYTVRVTAPATNGTYAFQRQIFQTTPVASGGIGFFDLDDNCVDLNIPVVGVVAYDSSFVPGSSTIDEATSFAPGDSAVVTVTVENTGASDWTTGDSIYLVSRNSPSTLWTSATSFGPVSTTVANGGTFTFSFRVTAPATPGTYDSSWQLYRSGVGTFFGDTVNVSVTVSNSVQANYDATLVSQTIPSSTTRGRSATFSLTFENTGSQAWSGSDFRLLSVNSPVGLWGVSNVPLGGAETVAPGAQKTFSFTVQAPTTAGSYSSAWRMEWPLSAGGVGPFGDTASSSVEVVDVCGNDVIDAGELCDDGNRVDTDACSNSCNFNPQSVGVASATPAGRTFVGPSGGRSFSKVVIGDVTGDGIDDVIVGGPTSVRRYEEPPEIRDSAGAIYGFVGGEGFFTDTATTAHGSPSFAFWGARALDQLAGFDDGRIALGDVTGDGILDILVSAARGACASGSGNCGRVYVIRGGSHLVGAGVQDMKVIADPVMAVLVAPNDGDGALPLAVGDLTGDGIDDIAVGHPGSTLGGAQSGAITLVTGGTLTGTITLSGGNVAATITAGAGARLGYVAAIGDMNGAGADDLLIGAPAWDGPGGSDSGGAFALFAPISGSVNLSATPREWNARWQGANIRTYLGRSVEISDVGGGTAPDILLGTPGQLISGVRYGSVDVIAGPVSDGLDTNFAVSFNNLSFRVFAKDSGDYFGWCLTTGDINGDGRPDLIGGAPFSRGTTNTLTNAGEVLAMFGGGTFQSTQITSSNSPLGLTNGEDQARMCIYLGGVASGDLDGDGRDDVCAGSPLASSSVSTDYRPGRVDCTRSPF